MRATSQRRGSRALSSPSSRLPVRRAGTISPSLLHVAGLPVGMKRAGMERNSAHLQSADPL